MDNTVADTSLYHQNVHKKGPILNGYDIKSALNLERKVRIIEMITIIINTLPDNLIKKAAFILHWHVLTYDFQKQHSQCAHLADRLWTVCM